MASAAVNQVAPAHDEMDSLSSLEQRIHKAVQIVLETREKNADLEAKLKAMTAERDGLTKVQETLKEEVAKLSGERDKLTADQSKLAKDLEATQAVAATVKGLNLEIEKWKAEAEKLGSERKQVKTRIEKLLGQMDLLGNA